MSYSYLLLGAPGSGKSTLALQALQWGGSGLVALAPGLDEAASYNALRNNAAYKIKGFDDPEFYPSAGSWTVEGYDALIGWLRGAYGLCKAAIDKGEPLPFNVLVTDTFNAMTGLAQNKVASKLRQEMPPPGKSPDGAAYWGLHKNLQEALARGCRALKGLGVTWIATCHVAERDPKEIGLVNPEQVSTTKPVIAPAISGGYRDVLPAAFDVVLHMGVVKQDGLPTHYVQWRPDAKRPTKSRLGALAEHGKIPADWQKLQERIRALETA